MNSSKKQQHRIVAHWRRFSSGLWRVPRGDIADAYSGDAFPKIKVFVHEGRLFTNGGGGGKWLEAEMNCYPLIVPDEYHGADSVPYSYEGREAAYRGKVFRLGAKILFVSSDPTIDEWRHLIRVFYADGGHFAAYSTYAEFLVRRFMPESKTGREARWQEMAEFSKRPMPQTQEEMRLLLASGIVTTEQTQQVEFVL